MRYFCQLRWLLASTITFVLFLVLCAGTTHMNAQGKPSPHKGKGETPAASEEAPIEKLGRMIVGTWAIDATSEPREAGSKAGKDFGKSMIRFGPGKLALIEDYRTHGDQGTRVALGLFWWDAKQKATGLCSARTGIPAVALCTRAWGIGKPPIGFSGVNSRPKTKRR
jgi:hypothetical protein